MLRLLIVLFTGLFIHPTLAQISYPTYRTTNGIPDVAGHQVTNPTPKGGIFVFSNKNGEPQIAPIKIREYHPEENQEFTRQGSSIKASEFYFNPEILPPARPQSLWIGPVPLREGILLLDRPIRPSFHHMPMNLSPVLNNPIFEDLKIGEIKLRQD
jgi:hypothetical protein